MSIQLICGPKVRFLYHRCDTLDANSVACEWSKIDEIINATQNLAPAHDARDIWIRNGDEILVGREVIGYHTFSDDRKYIDLDEFDYLQTEITHKVSDFDWEHLIAGQKQLAAAAAAKGLKVGDVMRVRVLDETSQAGKIALQFFLHLFLNKQHTS